MSIVNDVILLWLSHGYLLFDYQARKQSTPAVPTMQLKRADKRIGSKAAAYFVVIWSALCILCYFRIQESSAMLQLHTILLSTNSSSEKEKSKLSKIEDSTSMSSPSSTAPISLAAGMTEYTPKEGHVPTGVLSTKNKRYFDNIRFRIDNVHVYDRCKAYSFLLPNATVRDTKPVHRRIFFGSLLADEPWELLEIIAAETYQLFSGMVFVESNRTQHFSIRPLQRIGKENELQKMFGVGRIQIRTYVNEDPLILDLAREHEQRQEILTGWKEMGMTAEDVGYIADADETFSRDFLKAVQECPNIEMLNYNSHKCHPIKARLQGAARIFEALPDCIAQRRTWHHPDMVIGACIEVIGASSVNPVAPREAQFLRSEGFGSQCNEAGLQNITDGNYPLYNAADFRRACGGQMIRNTARGHTEYSAFHFHNFFANFNQTRFKYKSYGHPQYGAFRKKLEDLHEDLELVYRCVHNMTNADNTTSTKVDPERIHQREEGGLLGTKPHWPVYFHDDDYRARKYQSLYDELIADEIQRQAYIKGRQEAELARRANIIKNSKLKNVLPY